jgi:hypothetical protein
MACTHTAGAAQQQQDRDRNDRLPQGQNVPRRFDNAKIMQGVDSIANAPSLRSHPALIICKCRATC